MNLDLRGYCAIYRRIWDSDDSPITQGRKFTDFEAWLFMFTQASFTPRIVDFHGYKVPIRAGELVVSRRELATTWKWDKRTVTKMLEFWACEEDPRITLTSDTHQWTTIRINNFNALQGIYQEECTSDSPPDVPPDVPPLQEEKRNNEKTKNVSLGSAKKAKPGRGVKKGFSDDCKRIVQAFQKLLQESGQTVFAEDWYLTSLSCCEPLLKQGKPPAEIEKVADWAVRQWDCRATVTHFKHVVTAYPHYERSHAKQTTPPKPKERWQKLIESPLIVCIYPPNEVLCGQDFTHKFGTGNDAQLIHKTSGEVIRAGDYKPETQ